MAEISFSDTNSSRLKLLAVYLKFFFLLLLSLAVMIGHDAPSIRFLSATSMAIILEGIPFLAIGALIGGVIEVYLNKDFLLGLRGKKGGVGIFFSAMAGFFTPLCECGIVPVTKRLVRKGLPPPFALAFMLAAPALNPLVFFSTYVAFGRNWEIAFIRVGLSFIIILFVMLFLSRMFRHKSLVEDEVTDDSICSCVSCHADHLHQAPFVSLFNHTFSDFLDMLQYLVIASLLAASAQTFLMGGMTQMPLENVLIVIILMMVFAVLVNLCSSTDAFLAASFTSFLPFPAVLSFMLIGPLFDFKLLLMYQGFLKREVILSLTVLVSFLVLVVSLVVYFAGGY